MHDNEDKLITVFCVLLMIFFFLLYLVFIDRMIPQQNPDTMTVEEKIFSESMIFP